MPELHLSVGLGSTGRELRRSVAVKQRIRRRVSAGSAVALATLLLAGCGGSSSTPAQSLPPPTPTPTSGGLVVVVLGDSIATGSEGGSGKTYGEVYAALLEQTTGKSVELTNLADPSETSDSLLKSLASAVRQRAVAKADVVVITVGGNDGDPFATYDPGVCATDTGSAACLAAYAPNQAANLDAIVTAIEKLRGGRHTAIRLTSPDYNPFIGVDHISGVPKFPHGFGLTFFRRVIEAENDNACQVAAAHRAACVDFLHVFNGPEGDRPATTFLGPDHLHPSEAGREAIAKALTATGLGPVG